MAATRRQIDDLYAKEATVAIRPGGGWLGADEIRIASGGQLEVDLARARPNKLILKSGSRTVITYPTHGTIRKPHRAVLNHRKLQHPDAPTSPSP